MNRLKQYFAVIALTLPGCAMFQQQVETSTAPVADQIRTAAEFTLCRAMTVGAWQRAYGADAAKASAWRTLCAVPAATEVPAIKAAGG